MTLMESNNNSRQISLGDGLPAIPERLLLAHARGEVLFICGAGISKPANLPDFRKLVLEVYQKLGDNVHHAIAGTSCDACDQREYGCANLTQGQNAEVKRFKQKDYDVVLGMLERRLDHKAQKDSSVRKTVVEILRTGGESPASIHFALMQLADRGGTVTIVTTNFDRLLEEASDKNFADPVESYALASIPRPTRRPEFAGVMHIHGVLEQKPSRFSDLVLSDQDLGEFYLRQRVVTDFIYDAARLFHLVLVGYSANDPPMRYLLNAIAADEIRFPDIKERFIFFGTKQNDPVAIEDWKARGITPIPYDSKDSHSVLSRTLNRWAMISPHNSRLKAIENEVLRIVKTDRFNSPDSDKEIFDHLLRRSNASERTQLSELISQNKADIGWLDAIVNICASKD